MAKPSDPMKCLEPVGNMTDVLSPVPIWGNISVLQNFLEHFSSYKYK